MNVHFWTNVLSYFVFNVFWALVQHAPYTKRSAILTEMTTLPATKRIMH